ncbi:MAG: helix-turn-helix transcriptional regulator [Magnetococcales bacterium]|nr:helix-turn-helix transcriptional regulator [Magnetococcales bacterium]
MLATATDASALHAQFKKLSPREREVLAEVAKGLLNKEIADRLNISAKTVETHCARIMQKIGARTRSELIAMGTRIVKGNG